MAKKVDTWWDIWLPEEEDLLVIGRTDSSKYVQFDFSFLRQWVEGGGIYESPLDAMLRRMGGENLNSKIYSGIDLGYKTVEGVIPFIVSESIEKDKAYLIDFTKLYTYDKPFRIK